MLRKSWLSRLPLSPARLIALWDRLRSSFWFMPSGMTAAAVLLAYGLVEADARLGAEGVRDLGWLYTFGPEGARAILSAVAGSMITVAGLTFSMTMLTLQLASSQFGPRLLRDFMRDRGNQVVLGTFVATFVYCLLVLRTVRGTEGASNVPHLSVSFGVLLALASLALLIYFIHHVATSIRIETVLDHLAAEAVASIDRLYPERVGREPADHPATTRRETPPDFALRAKPIAADRSGYVQRIDPEALLRLATEHDLLLRIEARPGRFVKQGDALLSLYGGGTANRDIAEGARDAFVVGSERSPDQDLAFTLRRLVEIAQRALSPGINDPTTALYCLDRLEEALVRLAERDPPSPVRLDEAGRIRVLTEVDTLDELATSALAAVARYGLSDADVVRRLLQIVGILTRGARATPLEKLGAFDTDMRRQSGSSLTLAYDRDLVQVD